MVYTGKLIPVGTGNVVVLHLRPHGRSVLFMESCQFCWSGPYLQSTRSAIEAHTTASTVFAHRALVDVVHNRDVHIVDRAVVVEMSAAPVATLVAKADITKAVVNAAVVADVGSPVTAVEAIAVMVVTPIAGSPEGALIGSLDPHAGYPVVAALSPCPVAGSPEIVVARSLRLFIIGEGRRCLIRILDRLRAVTGIVRASVIVLIGLLVSSAIAIATLGRAWGTI